MKIDQTVRFHRKVRDFEPFRFQLPARVQDALVLRLAGDDVLLSVAVKPSNAFDRHVVGLRRAGREDDFLRVCADDRRNVGTGCLNALLRIPAVLVGATVGVS